MSEAPLEALMQQRLEAIRARIRAAAERAGRAASEITLVGVSKRQAPARVAAAVRAGVRELGENYVQEAADKRAWLERALAETGIAAPRWRMIGGLQRNKARAAAATFDAVDSLDRDSLARELGRRAAAIGRRLDVCLQVNLSGESQKGGASERDLAALLETCSGLPELRVVGLMTIPAAHPDPEAARPVYARLRALRDRLRSAPGGAALRELSMGMSGDFEVAIEEGATLVRIGTALFGARGEDT